MKTVCLLLLALAASAADMQAQSFTVPWLSIDGGGGSSEGGPYSITGSIGQPDAGGPLSGGAYSVTGGFWALPGTPPVLEGPRLTITAGGGGQATISWSPAPPGFLLQVSESLKPADWKDVPGGFNTPILVTPGTGSKFYRLVKVETF